MPLRYYNAQYPTITLLCLTRLNHAITKPYYKTRCLHHTLLCLTTPSRRNEKLCPNKAPLNYAITPLCLKMLCPCNTMPRYAMPLLRLALPSPYITFCYHAYALIRITIPMQHLAVLHFACTMFYYTMPMLYSSYGAMHRRGN